jgi:methionine-rich copper-binding protein CopC
VPRLGTALLVFLAAAAWPAAAMADSELETSTPADGVTVASPFAGPIMLAFTEPFGDESEAELLDAGGSRVASATTDPAGASMRFDLESALDPGDYVVRWTTLATDGHVARGSFGFTVAPPPPTPEPTPTPTPEASATAAPATSAPATPEPSVVATPSPT